MSEELGSTAQGSMTASVATRVLGVVAAAAAVALVLLVDHVGKVRDPHQQGQA